MISGPPIPLACSAAARMASSWFSCVGVPAGEAEGRAGHQLPIGGAPFPEWPLPDPGFSLFRVHRQPIAAIEVEIHQGRRRVVLLCRPMAFDAGRRWVKPSRC